MLPSRDGANLLFVSVSPDNRWLIAVAAAGDEAVGVLIAVPSVEVAVTEVPSVVAATEVPSVVAVIVVLSAVAVIVALSAVAVTVVLSVVAVIEVLSAAEALGVVEAAASHLRRSIRESHIPSYLHASPTR